MKAKQLDKGVDQLMEELAVVYFRNEQQKNNWNSWSTTIRSNTIPFRT
jgi:peptide subunit release factor RF-3